MLLFLKPHHLVADILLAEVSLLKRLLKLFDLLADLPVALLPHHLFILDPSRVLALDVSDSLSPGPFYQGNSGNTTLNI